MLILIAFIFTIISIVVGIKIIKKKHLLKNKIHFYSSLMLSIVPSIWIIIIFLLNLYMSESDLYYNYNTDSIQTIIIIIFLILINYLLLLNYNIFSSKSKEKWFNILYVSIIIIYIGLGFIEFNPDWDIIYRLDISTKIKIVYIYLQTITTLNILSIKEESN